MVRHGESLAALKGIAGGHLGCLGLSQEGEAQARALGENLRSQVEDFSDCEIHTSNIARAMATAEISTGRPAASYRRSCGLCETHPGANDGKRWSDIGLGVDAGFYDPIGPLGESVAQMYRRADAHLGEMARDIALGANARRGVIAFTHSGVICAAYAQARRRAPEELFEISVPLCSAHLLEVETESATSESRLSSMRATIGRVF